MEFETKKNLDRATIANSSVWPDYVFVKSKQIIVDEVQDIQKIKRAQHFWDETSGK